MPQPPTENRRPIKSRAWPVFQRVAARLAAAGVSPNAISLSSILFGAAAGASLAATGWTDFELARRVLWAVAALCIQLRLAANLLDGLVAIEGGRGAITGELYNEAPDRVADAVILIGAGYAYGGEPMLGALAAIVAVFVAYIRALGASVGVGQVFLGPMAKPQRMAMLTAVAVFCAVAPERWQIDWLKGMGVVDFSLLAVIVGGLWTALRRLRRIAALMHRE